MEFKSNQAIYIQIADFICEQVLLRKWVPNERIPSVRELAADLEVNPNTVMRAYEFLQGKEIIFNRRGIGYSVSENASDLILGFRKERFVVEELPEFFRTLYLLNITMEELQSRYEAFVSATYPQIRK